MHAAKEAFCQERANASRTRQEVLRHGLLIKSRVARTEQRTVLPRRPAATYHPHPGFSYIPLLIEQRQHPAFLSRKLPLLLDFVQKTAICGILYQYVKKEYAL